PPRLLPSFPTRRSSDLVFFIKMADVRRFFRQQHFLPHIVVFLQHAAQQLASDALVLAAVQYENVLDVNDGEAVADNADEADQSIDRKSTRLNSSHVKIS